MDTSTEIVQDPNLSIKKKLLAKALKNEVKCSTLIQKNSPNISCTKAPKLILKNVLDKDDKGSCLLTERTRKVKKSESIIQGSETARSLSRKQEIQNAKNPSKTLRSLTPINKKDSNYNKNPLKSKEKSLSKPQSLAKLEGYFSEICNSIESTSKIEDKLMQKAENMQETLKDCLTAVPDLSLQFYILMSSILREIQDINRKKSDGNVCVLAQKLLQLGLYLENNKFLQKNSSKDIKEDLLADLNEKVSKITTRVITNWKKQICQEKANEIISISFFYLLSTIDPTIHFPSKNCSTLESINAIKNCSITPGELVLAVRNVPKAINHNFLPIHSAKKIKEMLEGIHLKETDNSMILIYEFLKSVIAYYECLLQLIGKNDIFDTKNDQDLEATATFNEGELQSIKEQSNIITISDINTDSMLDVSFSDKNVNITFSPKGDEYNDEEFIHSSSIITRTEPSPKSQKKKSASIFFGNPLNSFNKDTKTHRRIISSQPKKNISHDFKNCLDLNFLTLEKFKEFLKEKISIEINEMKTQKYDPIKLKNEVYNKAIEKREEWLREVKGEYEDIEVIIMNKPGYEKRFSAEVVRAQRNFEESNRRKMSVNWIAKDIHDKKRKLEAVLNRFKK